MGRHKKHAGAKLFDLKLYDTISVNGCIFRVTKIDEETFTVKPTNGSHMGVEPTPKRRFGKVDVKISDYTTGKTGIVKHNVAPVKVYNVNEVPVSVSETPESVSGTEHGIDPVHESKVEHISVSCTVPGESVSEAPEDEHGRIKAVLSMLKKSDKEVVRTATMDLVIALAYQCVGHDLFECTDDLKK